MKICPIILSGGSGTRLWPLSRRLLPKQFLKLNSNESLIVETAKRVSNLPFDTIPPVIVCSEEHQFLVSNQLEESNCEFLSIILEPAGKNTAPATALAANYLKGLFPQEDFLILVMPADHKIENLDGFVKSVEESVEKAKNSLCVFGIKPDAPSTSYGYIYTGKKVGFGCAEVLNFHEKPNLTQATEYLTEGGYYWNSGIFLFSNSFFLESINKTDEEISLICKDSIIECEVINKIVKPSKSIFESCPSNSIDYALMERAFHHEIKVNMSPLYSEWSDLGTWKSLYQAKIKDKNNNALEGDVLIENSNGCYVYTNSGLVAATDINDIVIVRTDDVVFVAPLDKSEEVKGLVDRLKDSNREEVDLHKEVHRPWGTYRTVTEETNFKVKRIKVYPGSQLSLQLHHKRAEHWVVAEGEATVIKGDDRLQLKTNESVYIEVGEKHSLENNTENLLEIIEVQIGSYLGEDDIVRFEDKYGRV